MSTEIKLDKEENNSFDLGKAPVKSIFKKIWIPTMIATLIGGTFVVFDTIFVSHGFHEGNIGQIWTWTSDSYSSLGPTAMSYVMPYTLILVAVAMMLGGGLANRITKAKAANNYQESKNLINSHLPIAVFYGAILTITYLFLAKFFIWMGTGFQSIYLDNWFNNPLIKGSDWTSLNGGSSGHVLSQAAWYLRIQGLAAIPYVYMYASALVLRVEGKAEYSTKVNIVALGVNVVLDFTLINVFGLNLIGAATATVIAETIGMIMYLRYFKNKFPLRADKPNWKYAWNNTFKISADGTSSLSMQLNAALMLLVFTMTIGFINYDQNDVINTYTSAFQSFFSFYMLFNLIVIGTSVSIAPIVTYNAQIGEIDRALEAKKIGYKVNGIFAGIVTFVLFIFPILITSLVNTENAGYTQRIIQVLIIGFTLNAFILMAGVYFQGVGENKKSNIILYSKPILLLIFVAIMGIIFNNTNTLGAWENSIFPWNDDIVFLSGFSIGMFWGLPITDVILGSITIYLLIKDTKNVKQYGFKHIKDVKDSI